MSDSHVQGNKFTSIEAVQQIESLIYRLKKELSQKEGFITNLEEKLSAYYKVNKNQQTQTLENKLKELNESVIDITNNRKLMRDEIVEMECNIAEQKSKQFEIVSEIHNAEREYKSEMLHIKKDKLNTLANKRMKLENDILLRETQLSAITEEIEGKNTDDTHLNNTDLLLKRAKILEMELNDPNYYNNFDDRIQNNFDEIREIGTIKHQMINNRKLEFENEQNNIRNNVQTLKEKQRQIQTQIESVESKRNNFNETISSLPLYNIVRLELNDLQNEFEEKDMFHHNSDEYMQCKRDNLENESNDNIIDFVCSNVGKMEQKIEILQNNLENALQNGPQINVESSDVSNSQLYYLMKAYLTNTFIIPFCDRYIMTKSDLNNKHLLIEKETILINKDLKTMMRKQNQTQLNVIFGEIEMELINEVMYEIIQHCFDGLKELNSYSQTLAHNILLNSITDCDDNISKNCLNQLIIDREKNYKSNTTRRFTLRHNVCSLKDNNSGISDENKELDSDEMKERKKIHETYTNDGMSLTLSRITSWFKFRK